MGLGIHGEPGAYKGVARWGVIGWSTCDRMCACLCVLKGGHSACGQAGPPRMPRRPPPRARRRRAHQPNKGARVQSSRLRAAPHCCAGLQMRSWQSWCHTLPASQIPISKWRRVGLGAGLPLQPLAPPSPRRHQRVHCLLSRYFSPPFRLPKRNTHTHAHTYACSNLRRRVLGAAGQQPRLCYAAGDGRMRTRRRGCRAAPAGRSRRAPVLRYLHDVSRHAGWVGRGGSAVMVWEGACGCGGVGTLATAGYRRRAREGGAARAVSCGAVDLERGGYKRRSAQMPPTIP